MSKSKKTAKASKKRSQQQLEVDASKVKAGYLTINNGYGSPHSGRSPKDPRFND